MLNLDFICQHPQVVRDALRKRRDTRNIDDILRLAEQRRGLMMRSDGLYTSLKAVRDSLRGATEEKRALLDQQIKAITQDIRLLELQSTDVDTRLQLLLLNLPNLPHQSVHEGKSKADDLELRRWGEPLSFLFSPLSHWDLGARLGLIDTEGGNRIAGNRFVALKGPAARLERALISFMLDVYSRDYGYTEVMPPLLAKRAVMVGAGHLPRFEEQSYTCSADELYLNPATEVPLIGLHCDSILGRDTLPLRYVASTTAFRRDTGSTPRQARSLLGLHQFSALALLQILPPAEVSPALEQMLFHAEIILRLLELPYRVMALCSGNLPFSAARALSVEVWMPGLQSYLEVSTVSSCEDFPARRANIKFRPSNSARAEYVHIAQVSGPIIGHVMAAIMEIYQQADGSVVVPKVLRPYIATSQLAPSRP